MIDSLLTELKRLDDKMVLTEVHLLESRVYRGIGNLPKAKVALILARATSCSYFDIGSLDLFAYSCQFYILPTVLASLAGFAIRYVYRPVYSFFNIMP